MKVVDTQTYRGVGDLNVPTSRGDIKAKSGDLVVTFDDGSKWVVPQEHQHAEVAVPGPDRDGENAEGPNPFEGLDK